MLWARDDTCYIPESRINVEYEDRENRTMTSSARIQHNCAKIKLWFSPLASPRGENPASLRLGASFRLRFSYRAVLLIESLLIFGGF